MLIDVRPVAKLTGPDPVDVPAVLAPVFAALGGVVGSGLAERGVAGSGLAERGVAGSGLAERGVAGSELAEGEAGWTGPGGRVCGAAGWRGGLLS